MPWDDPTNANAPQLVIYAPAAWGQLGCLDMVKPLGALILYLSPLANPHNSTSKLCLKAPLHIFISDSIRFAKRADWGDGMACSSALG